MKLTIDQFHASKAYLACTPKQRAWVDIFLQTQDSQAATRAAYSTKTPESARTLTYSIRASRNVRAAVNVALGRSEQDMFLEEVQRHLDAAQPGSVAALNLLRMKIALQRLGRVEETRPSVADSGLVQVEVQSPRRSTIGTTVIREGMLFRVTAEDENFEPTAGDRVDKNGVRIPDDSPIDFVANETE